MGPERALRASMYINHPNPESLEATERNMHLNPKILPHSPHSQINFFGSDNGEHCFSLTFNFYCKHLSRASLTYVWPQA